MLLWLGLLQFPLPSPLRVSAVDKDRSVPYPCMDRPCGCASAEQCWTSCCCTTRDERIDWAREHLGFIPEALREPDIPKSETSDTDHEHGRLAASSSAGLKSPEQNDPDQKCCDRESGGHDCCGRPTPPDSPRKSTPTTVLSAVMKCRGLCAAWSLFSVAIPLGLRGMSPERTPRSAPFALPQAPLYASLSRSPPRRPPRADRADHA